MMFTYQTTVLYCLVPKLTHKPTFHFKKTLNFKIKINYNNYKMFKYFYSMSTLQNIYIYICVNYKGKKHKQIEVLWRDNYHR